MNDVGQAGDGARPEDIELIRELRARLVQVGAAATLGAPTEHATLLELVVRTAMHVLDARAGSLYLVDEEGEELVFEVALGERAGTLRGARIPLGQGIAGYVAATGQPIAIADVQHDPRWAQSVGEAVGYQPRTMLAMPLLLSDRVVGVLQLLDKGGGQPFDAGDMATLGMFANQAAVAIQQSSAVRSLSALVRAALTDAGVELDLAKRVAAFAAEEERGDDFREVMHLAQMLGDISRGGDAARRMALGVTEAIATYLRSRPRYGM